MSKFELAVARYGWQKVEAAAFTWAGRLRRPEQGCPALVGAWRRAVADVVDDFVAADGVYGLRDLAKRIVHGVEGPATRANVLDDAVARWSRCVEALDTHSGAPSSFPQTVLSASDLDAIAAVAAERCGTRREPRLAASRA
ncbi:hypothetical protein ACIGCK_09290 [Microbacterium sp. NPDC078428]|uniref:hypothetical protein n=1 Tax=Microbacterium sp. NPDC078428 TaxID=3364190 RepID=UPI0037C7FF2D